MAALTGTLLAASQVPFRDTMYRQETWSYTTTTTGTADEWVDVGSEIISVIGWCTYGAAAGGATTPQPNFVLNASGTSVAASANPGNLAVETNGVSGTHTFHVTVITRP